MTGASAVPVVSLRAVEDGDLPLFFEWQSDEESYRMAAVPTRDAESFAAHWARNRSNPENYMRTIVADGVVVGNVVSWTGGEGRMVGYWIGKEHWGRGIASAALRLYLDHVEQHRPCSRPSSSTTRARAACSRRQAFNSWRGSSWTMGRSPAPLPSCTSGSARSLA